MSEARTELVELIRDIDAEMDKTLSHAVLGELGRVKRRLSGILQKWDAESVAEYEGDPLYPNFEPLADWERELLEQPAPVPILIPPSLDASKVKYIKFTPSREDDDEFPF